MTDPASELASSPTFSSLRLLGRAFLALIATTTLCAADSSALLWQIGQPDGDNAEFAFAPKGYHEFREDGFFVVGRSEAKRDWPYVHPGPVDGWAGGGSHTFSVVFGVRQAGGEGTCRLKVALLDTHSTAPPKVKVQVNERAFEQALPNGAGDASVNGEPAKGKRHEFQIEFPAATLKVGDNRVDLTTLSGSWLLYDWLGLEVPGGLESAPVISSTVVDAVESAHALLEKDGKLFQPVRVSLRHFGEEAHATVRVEGVEPQRLRLVSRAHSLEVLLPAVAQEASRSVTVEVAGKAIAARSIALKPVRKLTVYVLPHSHTDIGYTEIQTAIEKKQIENLRKGIEYARRTADYPPGAQFKWNVEVLWAADLYLQRLGESERKEFLDAVKKGWVGLNGMYLNELTGLCRPEELLRLFRFSTQLAEQCGVTIDSAMISDVPGYTWGTVTAMAHAGIKYFSTAPNYFDRIGDILVQWENKPFWWVGPSGRERVLVWIPFKGYAMSHIYHKLTPAFVAEYQAQLEKTGYAFDIAYVRWSGYGDNAEPDPAISEFVKEWNTKYAWPKFIIASTSEAFRAFEQRYGDKLPVMRGDWTPYWEDGAGSSALETALNRASSDRLTQAEALYAMLNPAAYPAKDFEAAWRNVLLYSEHTWGAWCGVSDPENQMTKEQWEIKRSYALEADRLSRELLTKALASVGSARDGLTPHPGPLPVEGRGNATSAKGGSGSSSASATTPSHATPSSPSAASSSVQPALGSDVIIQTNVAERSPSPLNGERTGVRGEASSRASSSPNVGAVDVFNTTSWLRSELVVLSKELSSAGDRALDARGRPVPSQRLSSGELAFIARDVPPLAARRYTIATGPAHSEGEVTAHGSTLDNGLLRVRVDEQTGALVELTARGLKGNLADTASGHALNDYLFLPGDNLADLKRNGPVRISVKERGPLVASLLIESDAPGCRKLTREVRLVAGFHYVELINTVDKQRAQANPKPGDWTFAQKGGKESVNFAFPFNVPDGVMRLDVPFGVMEPERDQMPSACKNWFTAGRWADVSNDDFGITWITLDAPLVQVGGITATLVGSQANPAIWRKRVERTQKLYSWAMNNHWGTNYRAYQEGPVVFRFALRPHRKFTPADATKLATALSQPLLATPARGEPLTKPLFRVEPSSVVVTGLKPSDDGQAWIVRLFGAAGKNQQAKLAWASPAPEQIWRSDISEKPLRRTAGRLEVPASGVATLRVERPE
ncbi:MAG: hypothetical protein HYY24_12515 [Verrucomicrobia bacterium]|nr:hypothetical protein [Verrucomicrobiota bacterium]